MTANPAHTDQQLLPRVRHELQATRQIYDGQPYWVVKDPLSLRYYRFNREEYFLIRQLQQGVTVEQLKQAHRHEFKTDTLDNAQLGQFIRQLLQKNLLIMEHHRRDELLYQFSKKIRWSKTFAQFSNFMFFKIPLWDPDKFFDRLEPRIRFFWSRTFFMLYLLLMALAVTLVIRRWSDFEAMFADYFFTLRNVPVLIAAFWLTKALHEFGHGLTCKHYGGEVHEIGFLFLVFAPFLYCNVTDSWTFNRKWQRLLVTAGGILTELIVAALAVVGWYFTDSPGFFHAFMFNLIITCSISTVLFNANPLLKFDGYYLMMDLIEVPNLRERSTRFIRNLFIRYVLGGHPEEMNEEHRFRYMFPIYSISAFIYRWFIMFMILGFVYSLMRRLNLVMLGRALVAVSVVLMLALPLYKSAQSLVQSRRSLGISNTRLLLLLALIIGFALVALFWPYSQHVTLNFILEPRQVQWVRNDVPGQLSWFQQPDSDPCRWNPLVRQGVWFNSTADNPGPVLARLTNPRLDFERKKILSDIRQLDIDTRYFVGDPSQVSMIAERRAALVAELDRLDHLVEQLELHPPFAGCVLTDNRTIQALQGSVLERGSPLFQLADTHRYFANVWVPEKTWQRIFRQGQSLNQAADLLLYTFSDKPFPGRVVAVNQQREINMGEFDEKLALSNKVGGEVVTERDPRTGRERPIDPVYEVTIALDHDALPDSARPYMSGRARIDCGKSTLFQWGYQSLLRFISPEIRL